LISVPEHEKTVGCTDEDVVMKHREVQAAEPPGEDVEEEGDVVVVLVLEWQVEHDPVVWSETEVGDGGKWRWLGDGRAPAGADGPHVHVRLTAAGGGEDAVGDALEKLR
jgi:hypothetical protein